LRSEERLNLAGKNSVAEPDEVFRGIPVIDNLPQINADDIDENPSTGL
jgi:hypothetical protein